MNLQNFTALLLVVVALTQVMMTCDAKKNKRKTKRSRSNGSKIKICPPVPLCQKNRQGDCSETADLSAAQNSLINTVNEMTDLNASLAQMVSNLSYDGKDDVHPGYGTLELNPTESKFKDVHGKMKVVYQVTWWLAAIEAFLRHNDVHTVLKDEDRRLTKTITGNLDKTQKLLKSFYLHLGHGFTTKSKANENGKLFACYRIKLKKVCSKGESKPCSKERSRAYIMVRDMARAVSHMLGHLRGCSVEEEEEEEEVSATSGGQAQLKCGTESVFYKCRRKLFSQSKKDKSICLNYEA